MGISWISSDRAGHQLGGHPFRQSRQKAKYFNVWQF
jgi:hypothetical protein